MQRDFRYLRDKYSDSGAREIFEDICTQWLQSKYGQNAHQIRVSQGDGGIDILIGDTTKPLIVYQCKYFLDGIDDPQKQQIRDSFSTVINARNFTVREWYLCVPRNLTLPEFTWWSTWKTKSENKFNIPIGLCDGSYLLNEFKTSSIYAQAFDDDIRIELELILDTLTAQKRKLFEEIILSPD